MTAGTMHQCNDSANGRPIDTPGWRTRHTRHWTPVRITHTQRSARKDECMLQTLLACSPTSLDAGIPQKAKRPRPADGSTRSFDGLRRPDERTGTHRQRYPSSTGACSPGGKKRNGQRPPAACGPWPRSFLGCAAGWDDGANKRGIGQPDASDLRRRKLHQRATRARIPATKEQLSRLSRREPPSGKHPLSSALGGEHAPRTHGEAGREATSAAHQSGRRGRL